ncbi:unnamed protein product [Caenorhabditis auriculariae]|uniref:Galectin n=1 Tax=Caenorhabditis auriculariae TaxID=2777116 RepID=A0A8S1GXT5_9PELO|nr:unnamed protein product [Caenorhabditis auriculariae]
MSFSFFLLGLYFSSVGANLSCAKIRGANGKSIGLDRHLQVGDKLIFTGTVNPNAGVAFFNLDSAEGKISLHMKFFFSNKTVVLNSFLDHWGTPIRRKHFLARNEPFVVQIDVESDSYIIFLSGKYFYKYRHRNPNYTTVRAIRTLGDIFVKEIELKCAATSQVLNNARLPAQTSSTTTFTSKTTTTSPTTSTSKTPPPTSTTKNAPVRQDAEIMVSAADVERLQTIIFVDNKEDNSTFYLDEQDCPPEDV